MERAVQAELDSAAAAMLKELDEKDPVSHCLACFMLSSKYTGLMHLSEDGSPNGPADESEFLGEQDAPCMNST